jgi:hypothetical protein
MQPYQHMPLQALNKLFLIYQNVLRYDMAEKEHFE